MDKFIFLVGVLDTEQFYCFNSVNMILPKQHEISFLPKEHKISLKYILAILNSKLINVYYRRVFEQNAGLTVNVTQGYLEKIPIKVDCKHQKKNRASEYSYGRGRNAIVNTPIGEAG